MLQGFIREEAAASAGIHRSERSLHYAEAFLRHGLVFAEDNDSARAHVFLFADNGRDAFLAVEGECLVGMFQKILVLARFRGRHCRRKIDEPLGVAREPAHDFKSRNRVLLPDRDLRLQPSVDEALADHIGQDRARHPVRAARAAESRSFPAGRVGQARSMSDVL